MFTSALEKQIKSMQRTGQEGQEEQHKHAEACIIVAEEDDAVIWHIVHHAFKPLDAGLQQKLDEKAVDAMVEASVNSIDEVQHHRGFAELHVVINFLCKTSWADGVRTLAELIQLPDLFKHRYHSCLQTFHTDYQTQLKLFVRRYGVIDQSMLLDFAVMRVIQESDARHIVDARQELERRRVISGAIQDPLSYRINVKQILEQMLWLEQTSALAHVQQLPRQQVRPIEEAHKLREDETKKKPRNDATVNATSPFKTSTTTV